MQGSDPDPNSGPHNVQAIISAFTNNGQLKQDWVGRLSEVTDYTINFIFILFKISQKHNSILMSIYSSFFIQVFIDFIRS